MNTRAQKTVISTYLKQIYNESEIEKWWTQKHDILEQVPNDMLYNGEYYNLLTFVKSQIVNKS